MTEEDHFLPPDNYQEEPRGQVAHRTSPTNIGCYLLSVVAARDLGFISLAELLERMNATLATMERLERREGHILNWYDTTTLRALEPRYVSTVDSGNLAAYLWTVRQACTDLIETPILSEHIFQATLDALRLARTDAETAHERSTEIELERRIVRACNDSEAAPTTRLAELDQIARTLGALGAGHDEPEQDGPYWLETASRSITRATSEVRGAVPWLERLRTAPEELSVGALGASWYEFEESVALADSLSTAARAAEGAPKQLDALEKTLRETDLSDAARSRVSEYLTVLRADFAASALSSKAVGDALRALGERAGALADSMNFSFLYDEDRLLFSIGYNAQSERLDASHYDLLASEARLASFVAIAKGDVRQEHWFRLGRSLAAPPGGRALWSWSGSMFEYLMPLLVMKEGHETLLQETDASVVDTQRKYGEAHGTPWGISESLYNVMDLSMTYQYRAFGVPSLGLKTGLEQDLVIAPYATALAALVRPDLAVANLRALQAEGLDGRYGYYEAIDYTPARSLPGKHGVVVKAFMAHHQGMTLVALDNVISHGGMQRRFHADPRVQATELLLEERVPIAESTKEIRSAVNPGGGDISEAEVIERVPLDPNAWPRAHLLGHGDVSTIVTNVGTGVTTWRGLDVTRFREDSTVLSGGVLVYVRDLKTGRTWSIGYEPTRTRPDNYETSFFADRVEIRRRDGDIETVLEVVVSPECPAEMRRVTLTNHGHSGRELEVTTYSEVVLAPRNADRAHRVFSSMFVETEAIANRGAVLAHRRPRAATDGELWLAQVLTPEEGSWSALDYESSRSLFVGRGRELDQPAAFDSGARLSRRVGAVLDPALALRRSTFVRPGRSARVALTTALATDRDSVDRLAEQFADPHSIPRTFDLGRADARFELRHLGMTGADAAVAQRLLSAVVFPRSRLRAGGSLELHGDRGKNALWAQGISGDLPIVVLRLDDADFADIANALLAAHEFFRQNGFAMDLVLLDEDSIGYFHPRQDQAIAIAKASVAKDSLDRRGGVFIRRLEQISEVDRSLLLRAAHVVFSSSKGSLSRQLQVGAQEPSLPARRSTPGPSSQPSPARRARPALDFDNGIGGFDPLTGEYVMVIAKDRRPGAPWCNVVANPTFGFIVSESGATTTWSVNSQSNRLTPWSNDPVCDASGELIYVRDDEDGAVWSPAPAPAGGSAEYVVRHGFGYSSFEHDRGDVQCTLSVFVDHQRSAKVSVLRLTNNGARGRKLRAYGVVDWVLGAAREQSVLTVATQWDRECSAVLANNPFSGHPERCAFFASTTPPEGFTGDRSEFFGQNGSRARPAAMDRMGLSGRTGAGLDACAALEVPITLVPGESATVCFILGDSANHVEARELAAQFSEPGAVERSFEETRTFWRELLGKVTVRTPDAALDRLLNGWLLYQAVSCRIFGRSAFYQSSGAYGFRDQLQDVMSVLHVAPTLAREHVLRAAARQFVEGDVQHWWHPDTGQGVRTRCSDDMLWLPYVTAEYVRATGDLTILDEVVPFLDDKPIPLLDSEVFGKPSTSTDSAPLYEHCVRALDIGTTAGPHGLPLMGSGDWNDGMNQVGGPGGHGGESVWLAWFLAKTLTSWSSIAETRGDGARQQRFDVVIRGLSTATNESGWDGAYYRRGYFQDGTPLGSAQNEDCRIDAIAQSWATISGIADANRAAQALDQSETLLVRAPERMMSLLWPPFRSSEHDPGYIRAYPPGVRENGGQYTHGVLWTVLARTMLGHGERALELFSMLNPIRHASSPTSAARYAVEPYVVAADISASPGREGEGGWTWYTGAAGWMYRIGLENILGVRLDAGDLVISPCVPASFAHYEIDYRHGSSTYRIVVENPGGVSSGVVSVDIDGTRANEGIGRAPLVDDGRVHEVRVVLGSSASTRHNSPAIPAPVNSGSRTVA